MRVHWLIPVVMGLLVVTPACRANEDSEPDTGVAGDEFVVTMVTDGGCTTKGPTEVPPGEHTFALVNNTDRILDMAVRKIVGGYTLEDFLAYQGTAGQYVDRPDFIEEETLLNVDPYKTWTWNLTPGLHGIHLWNAQELWICSAFGVTSG